MTLGAAEILAMGAGLCGVAAAVALWVEDAKQARAAKRARTEKERR